MAVKTEMQLIENVKKSKWFALQLDESTDIQNSILVSYVRYTDYSVGDMTEVCVSVLPTQATGAEIFKAVATSLKKKGWSGKAE
jgi:hypothetical protein